MPGGELGFAVLRFDDASHVAAFADLHREAHLWVHRDYDHDAWHVLDVDEPHESGTDFVMMTRRPGVLLRSFSTDDPVPAAEDRIETLRDVLEKLDGAAAHEIDRFIVKLVRERVRTLDPHVIYDPIDLHFYLDNLDPSTEEMAAWRAATSSARALASVPVTWEATGDAAIPYRARFGGRALAVRLEAPSPTQRYTLIVDGEELEDLDGWPAAWPEPPPAPAKPPARG